MANIIELKNKKTGVKQYPITKSQAVYGSDGSAVSQKLVTDEADIASLKEQVSGFTRLSEGSTTGDAELINTRTTWYGTTEASAGNAVRNQAENLILTQSGKPTGNALKGNKVWIKPSQDDIEIPDMDDVPKVDGTLTVSEAAADAKITGDTITELKNDLILSNDGQQSVGVLSKFIQGATYNGEIQTYGKFRVANVNLITFSKPTQVSISSDFWILISFFVNGAFTSQTSWIANFYNIPAGSTVRFSIRRVTEQSSEIADIFEFTRAVTINTDLQDQINNLNTNLSGQVATLTTKVNQAVKSYGQISAANIGSLGWTSVTDFDANRIYGIGSDITNSMVTDLPYYGGYGQLKITAGIFPNIYKKYEYTNAFNDTWIAWQTNNNTPLSAWKKLPNAEPVPFKTVADRTQITPNSKVIFIGDSIVAGVGGTGWQQTSGRKLLTYNGVDLYASDEGICWANMMRDYLVTNYGCTAYNNGLSGFNSVNIPQNIAQLVPSDTTHVIACWGINDRAYNYDTVGGYQTVIDYCNSIGAKIVPVTICPCLQPNDTYSHTQYEILTRIKTVCENNNFEVCDLFSEVHEYFYLKGITLDTNYLPDKLHPNDAMYTIMYHLMKKLLGV